VSPDVAVASAAVVLGVVVLGVVVLDVVVLGVAESFAVPPSSPLVEFSVDDGGAVDWSGAT